MDIDELKRALSNLSTNVGKASLDLYKEHFNLLNSLRSPKSGYYAEAADTMTLSQKGNISSLTVNQVGIPLHVYGGIVKANNKLLTIPFPGVEGSPKDFPGELFFHYAKKNSDTDTRGYLVGTDGNPKYTLRSKVKIRPDKTIIPNDQQMEQAFDKAFQLTLQSVK